MRSAYDYYPFGMLMPGRYVSDTSQHCVTVSRPTWVWKWVISNCHDVYGWVWYNYLKVGRGKSTKVDDAILVDLPSASDGVSFDLTVTPHVAQQLQIDVKNLAMSDGGYIQL